LNSRANLGASAAEPSKWNEIDAGGVFLPAASAVIDKMKRRGKSSADEQIFMGRHWGVSLSTGRKKWPRYRGLETRKNPDG